MLAGLSKDFCEFGERAASTLNTPALSGERAFKSNTLQIAFG
jgi:hypothetical protein